MNYEEADRRWRLAMELRDYFADLGNLSVRGTFPLKTIKRQKGIETGPVKAKELLSHGPICCGTMVFSLSKTGRDIEYEMFDEEYRESRARLVAKWTEILKKKGLERALFDIAGFNLHQFDIDLKHMHPTADGWRVAFEAVDGEGKTPSLALIQALKRWVYGAPKVETKPAPKKKGPKLKKRIRLR
jgi:hypothetical protein